MFDQNIERFQGGHVQAVLSTQAAILLGSAMRRLLGVVIVPAGQSCMLLSGILVRWQFFVLKISCYLVWLPCGCR
jgi:hypothetical protein